MKIYVLAMGEYSDETMLCAFTEEKKATKIKETLQDIEKKDTLYLCPSVYELEVDNFNGVLEYYPGIFQIKDLLEGKLEYKTK